MWPDHQAEPTPDVDRTRPTMSDRYQSFTKSPIGKLLVKNLGLPDPVELDRWKEGAPLVDGTVVTGGNGRLDLTAALGRLGVANSDETAETEKYKGLVLDETGLTACTQQKPLQAFFPPPPPHPH